MIKEHLPDVPRGLPPGARFHETIASSWTKGYSRSGFGKRRECFAGILDRNVKAGKSWLDLGCGSGVLTIELLLRGANVLAVDGSPAMLKEAKLAVDGNELADVRWLECNVERLDGIESGSFDGILCSSVIEYVEHPDKLLDEAHRTLQSDGRLILSLPPKYSLVRVIQKMIRKCAALFGLEKFPYLAVSRFELGLGQLERKFSEKGFVVDKVTFFDPKLPGFLLPLVRPALLIVEARKKVRQ